MGKKTSKAAENIKVLVRCRPLNEKEELQGYKSCVDVDLTEHTVTVKSLVGEPDRWTFDAVINNTFSQRDIFTQFIRPLVDSVLEGYNATVFAYGQSGSGKTHTMSGKIGDAELQGITPRCFAHVFERIAEIKEASPNKQFSMYVSFVELYNGKVQDLLARQQVPLALKEN
ncbi:OSM3-like kinesin, putative, partial [Trypanosoma cruzi]